MDLKGKTSLRSVFAKYILYFSFGTVLLLVLFIIMFSLLYNTKVILPANYFEQKIESSRGTILKAEMVTENIIPEGCRYGVYNKAGKMIYGNFSSKASLNAWAAVESNKDNSGKNHYYKVFYRDHDICIVEYPLIAQFNHPVLRKYFVNAELIMGALLILFFIWEVFLLTARFRKYLAKEMKLLLKATEEIKKHNLNFQLEHSEIREIEEVISSLN